MRLVRYNVASSLDGFIAAPDGSYDWIPMDPAIDFAALFARVDTMLFGRHSADLMADPAMRTWSGTTRCYVFSDSAPGDRWPWATLVRSTEARRTVQALREEAGDGEIWLFGGGALFASLLAAGQVDRIEVTVVPVLLGDGIPLAARGLPRTGLVLADVTRYPGGGVTLTYAVAGAGAG
jgi:dihydrofolate reductase